MFNVHALKEIQNKEVLFYHTKISATGQKKYHNTSEIPLKKTAIVKIKIICAASSWFSSDLCVARQSLSLFLYKNLPLIKNIVKLS